MFRARVGLGQLAQYLHASKGKLCRSAADTPVGTDPTDSHTGRSELVSSTHAQRSGVARSKNATRLCYQQVTRGGGYSAAS